MFNPFHYVEVVFTAMFGKNGSNVQVILHKASSFVNIAEPIVEEVEVEVKAAMATDPSGKVALIEKYISKYETDKAKIQPVVDSLVGLPEADMFHNLATYALGFVAPKGAAASLLNLAVELAYNVLKSKTEAAPAKA